MTKRCARTLVAATCALAVSTPGAAATFPGANGRIAAEMHEYDRGDELNWELRLIGPSGANLRSLLRCDRGNVERAGACPLFAVRADGTGLVALTRTGGRAPACSRGAIAYVVNGHIRVWGVARSQRIALAEGDHPDWTPSGSFVVYDRGGDAYRIGAYGEHRRTLLRRNARRPVISPDGRRVAFVRPVPLERELGTTSVFTAPVRGGKPKLLLRGGEQPVGSTWDVYLGLSWQSRP